MERPERHRHDANEQRDPVPGHRRHRPQVWLDGYGLYRNCECLYLRGSGQRVPLLPSPRGTSSAPEPAQPTLTPYDHQM